MKTNNRINKIRKYLEENGFTTVSKLAEVFSVSTMTIRRDLNSLEELNLVMREKGGAIPKTPIFLEERYEKKKIENVRIKRKITKEAIKLIEDGDVVFLDAGSTTFMLAELIIESEFKNITLVTNDLNIAFYLRNEENINLIFIGGNISKVTHSSRGSIAADNIRQLHFDKCFMGVSFIGENFKLFTPAEEKIEYKRQVLLNTKIKVLLTDMSKFNKNSLYYITDIEEFDILITNKENDIVDINYFKERKLEVIKA
ncbi:DeoR/GlpR family DNA-binding transcription regulator [Miniphocaeibacter massiliensis]|uniref:DeoR/GlpR family DNA-binding transcription regulator n=1 Tax=Miniphocaeibacter massiliensis TaxID=2041841 RepID=UPI000C07A5FF|nr:DeoR/GlpR family DNA-binding transcription regulator [Miniphocaeibacter massiliensis]